MNRILYPGLAAGLLALAACSSTGRPDSATAERAAGTTEAGTAQAPSRADTLLAEGERLQAQGRCRDALQPYGMAALEAGPARGRALAAIHLCQWQLQRNQAGEESFALWLRHELEQGQLPLRLLFQPGETRYLADARISAPYGMWLRHVAEALPQHHCLTLVGHAGPSTVEQRAAELALRRAQTVQRQLERLVPALKDRIRPVAARPDQAIVGSASNDLRDALDRRVEFGIDPC